jgi:hypothetical protein
VLLVFVLIAGTVASAVIHVSPGFLSMANIDLFPLEGNDYDYTEHYESPARPGSGIEIVNRFGSVEVLPADQDTITVDVRKRIRADSQEHADTLEDQLTFSIVEQAGLYRVVSTLNRDADRARGRRFSTSLVVRVPARSNVRIDNRNGEVRLVGLEGDQVVTNGFARVEAREIRGSVEITNQNGEVVVEQVRDSLAVRNSLARTVVRDIGADLRLENRNGSVEVARIGGRATVSNSFAQTIVTDVTGDLTIRGRNSSVEVEGVGGNLDVEAAFEFVRIRGAGGRVRIDNRNGEVDLRFDAPPSAGLTVTAEHSSVTIQVPRSGFGLDLTTRFGEIETNLGIDVERDGPERRLRTTSTLGPTFSVRTTNGDIRLTTF